MPIFKISGTKLKKLNSLPLDKEKNLQALVEGNLIEVLDLLFLATEYTTTFGGRIDTLAVDTNGSPVIIEYKRNKNDNVINQSLSYLKWLKSQKPGFFEKLMIDKLGKDKADKIKLDWHNPRVICVAESYSKFDIDTAEVVPLRIELMKYRYSEDIIFALEPVNVPETAATAHAPMAVATSDPKAAQLTNTENSLENLLAKAADDMKALFAELRERIVAIDDSVTENPTGTYVGYRMGNNFAEVHIGKNQLKIHLRPIDYVDPKGMVDKIPDGYNWTMDRRVYLKSTSELEYVVGLIEQSYKNVIEPKQPDFFK
jgi:predicted transport protein